MSEPHVIVVGIDYSSYAEAALRTAYEQARRNPPAELHVVHVSLAEGADGLAPVPSAGLAAVPVLSLEEQRDALVRYIDERIPSLPGYVESGVRIMAHVVLDVPALGLARLAAELEAALIVVGTHGRGALARWLLGSVAEAVVRQANCPVLVVPPDRALRVPSIEPPCPDCLAARRASAGSELWCVSHRERHGRRHTYHQADRTSAETNFPLIAR